ncbi:seipin isoform X2 [Phaenicophaeus curvirostris]|uniref:seipin isoform X2 n=1 Tax=Phaenicophaeus curvirostris TaxID=33595 RepID=UPI0037F09F6D
MQAPPPLPWLRRGAWLARRAALGAGLAAGAALLALWAAALLYAAFHCAYVPASALWRPLRMRFRTDCDPPGPEICSFPTANVSLLGPNREKVLFPGQIYRLVLELEVPESPVNRALGMFMVSITIYDADGRPLTSAARSAMLHYRSRLLRTLDTVAFAALFLTGFAEQKQTLEIELSAAFREDPFAPAVGAEVRIESRRLQLYGARLRLHAHFSGLRYLLFHFPLTSAVLGIAGNFAFLVLLLGAGALQWGRGRARPPPLPPQEQRSEGPGPPQEGEGQDPDPLPEEEEGEEEEEEEPSLSPLPSPTRGRK